MPHRYTVQRITATTEDIRVAHEGGRYSLFTSHSDKPAEISQVCFVNASIPALPHRLNAWYRRYDGLLILGRNFSHISFMCRWQAISTYVLNPDNRVDGDVLALFTAWEHHLKGLQEDIISPEVEIVENLQHSPAYSGLLTEIIRRTTGDTTTE